MNVKRFDPVFYSEEGNYQEASIRESPDGALVSQSDYAELQSRLAASEADNARLRSALNKIADWNGSWGPFPKSNPEWQWMAVITAREAVPPTAQQPASGDRAVRYALNRIHDIVSGGSI